VKCAQNQQKPRENPPIFTGKVPFDRERERGGERERERDTHTHTDRQTERETETENFNVMQYKSGVSILGVWGSRAPRFWDGVVGVASWVVGGSGWVVKYYYILSCTGSMFEGVDFCRKI